MALWIFFGVVLIVGGILYFYDVNNRYRRALRLIEKKNFEKAQFILYRLFSKHSLAVTSYSECFLLIADKYRDEGEWLDAIQNYKNVLNSQNYLTSVSDVGAYEKIEKSAFLRIHKYYLKMLKQKDVNRDKIEILENNKSILENSKFNKHIDISQLIDDYSFELCRLYYGLGVNEEKEEHYESAKDNYSHALRYTSIDNHYGELFYNIIIRSEICKLKLGEAVEEENIKYTFHTDQAVKDDFFFRFTISLAKRNMLQEASSTLPNGLISKNKNAQLLNSVIYNEIHRKIINGYIVINNCIQKMHDNSVTISELKFVLNLIQSDELDLFQIGSYNLVRLDDLALNVVNRIIVHYTNQGEYWEVLSQITKFNRFFEYPLLMKNMGSATLNYLNINEVIKDNFKFLISYFLTSVYSDEVMLVSLEDTEWDDDFSFSLKDTIGYLKKKTLEIPDNVNFDDSSKLNISIGDVQRVLVSEFENHLNDNIKDLYLQKEVLDFYEFERKSIENIVKLFKSSSFELSTPFFAKRFCFPSLIVDALKDKYVETDNEEFLLAAIPYTKNVIKLFDNINGIIPGTTKLGDVLKRFGKPDVIDREKRSWCYDMSRSGNIHMTLLFNINETVDENSTITNVLVEDPFDGIAEEGIFIGMSESKCRMKLKEKYIQVEDLKTSCVYSNDKQYINGVHVWFENSVLSALRLEKPQKSRPPAQSRPIPYHRSKVTLETIQNALSKSEFSNL